MENVKEIEGRVSPCFSRVLNAARGLGLLIGLASQLTAGAADSAGARDWPQFRGPNCSGVTEQEQPPGEFGITNNFLWKTRLPPGLSSPCVVGERIFLTALEDHQLITIGIGRLDGKVLWRQVAPADKIEETHPTGSPASATPACDGERVYAYFASYGVLPMTWTVASNGASDCPSAWWSTAAAPRPR